ncbi:MAG: DinB family protein [Planctomycetota bacterium]|jgi:hypothetical protein
MNWTELLNNEIEEVYGATDQLMSLVGGNELEWKPETGENWMTMGQLLQHLPTACGLCMRGLFTGDWGLPEGQSFEDMAPEDMLPTADRMPTAESVAKARHELAADKAVALAMVAEAGEEKLANETITAPWDPRPVLLGKQFLGMVGHLKQHKGQLFYYLKLMGKPVNTHTLYGMPED